MMQIMLLRDLLKLFIMKKIIAFLPLNLIIGESSKIKDVISFVKSLELNIAFQCLQLHNRMEMLKGKAGLRKS